MSTTEANIEITRRGKILSSVSVIMPTWAKIEDDNIMSINIPLLGLKTFAKDHDDAHIAIEEAIKCFCISAEKFGNGLEAELQKLGWGHIKNKNQHTLLDYSIPANNFVFEQIMQTGEQYSHTDLEILEIA